MAPTTWPDIESDDSKAAPANIDAIAIHTRKSLEPTDADCSPNATMSPPPAEFRDHSKSSLPVRQFSQNRVRGYRSARQPSRSEREEQRLEEAYYPTMNDPLRVALVDDNYWKRSAMAAELNAHPDIDVVILCDQDQAMAMPDDQWKDVDIAIVDVFDEYAPGEVGTDVFSGISALERLRALPPKTFAVTPLRGHPLIDLRIYQCGADWVYNSRELNGPGQLVGALLAPDVNHRPLRPSDASLAEHGARTAHPNDAVHAYELSPLHGQLRAELDHRALGQHGVPKRGIDSFRVRIHQTGFRSTEQLSTADRTARVARWPDVRDYMLKVLGRKGTGMTDRDRE